MKKVLPPTLFALCLIAMIAVNYFSPITRFAVYPFNLIGIVLFFAGLGISTNGKRHFSRVGTNIMTFSAPDILVTDGLFAYSRNPMYLGFSIALIGAALLLGSLATLIIVIGFVLVADMHYIKYEETQMLNTFGDDYVSYCERVRRWV